ncbi:hypothetical protein [Paraburkholderia unamae]|jgi:hypothetical protein|uniref:Uncharacterized protein n=1 Tax=Paraburkholderia unamae TaxID=219649 RepID=A0ABX5KC07_9BURK|nr:hypothetical protein [Paraburkholderia unamae]PVX73570.1 hypothetical protein C7402_12162 [Paraburkholderia unamae]RAR56226.1 hypothetical protein C7401_12091 [Paraburkholderia unamae]CAG9246478.1 conserved exported hypothetical protein [Paraburkholderia unamae]
MKKVSLAVLISLSALTGAAYAQSDNGITMSTDPARADDVLQRAQALQQRQDATPQPAAPAMHHKSGHSSHHKKPAQSQ